MDNFLQLTSDYFLSRKACSFDTNVQLIITNIDTDEIKTKVLKKIELFFGDVDCIQKDNSIITMPKDLIEKTRFGYSDLVEIIYRLRDKDGCPWDKAQTPTTIRENIIEEAYELVDAINNKDIINMKEETGDVLLQSVFTSVMTEQENLYNHIDVITSLCQKLIFRHTHIFGKDKANNADEALSFWEKAKATEKGQKNVIDKLDSIPNSFTSLQKANKIQKYVSKVNFEFPNDKEAIDKIYEEIEEFKNADPNEKENEAGDILFSVVNIIRRANIDPEVALSKTNKKFKNRFLTMYKLIESDKKDIKKLTIEELDTYYNKAKEILKNK